MQQDHKGTAGGLSRKSGSRTGLRRLFRSKDGAAAIEFALLAIPYFLIVFAIIETFVAYTAEQLVANAVDTMGRKLRTGNITYAHGNSSTDKSAAEFRTAFCGEISILIQCGTAEITTPNKLWIDVKSYSNFSDMPATVPIKANGDLDTTSLAYSPGGPNTKNMLRVYYKWEIITDLLRPYITNIKPTDSSRPNYFLIVETSVFKNEEYP
ncbi:pilus assembly protein [Aliirhizobium terrae]|uniref:TadE/TadG family type IV pilus assembly protein n=1 Tax=Terrirhizobium terrae TaxID=2926709 RepID=UPI0025775D6D|nr:TadE/TadG family type IV pilus assembly protein [Rhizobium sp. CC-CFT758]WJH41905.1 pilus assembly protein [Rhizobium sp. CC-CFT758]